MIAKVTIVVEASDGTRHVFRIPQADCHRLPPKTVVAEGERWRDGPFTFIANDTIERCEPFMFTPLEALNGLWWSWHHGEAFIEDTSFGPSSLAARHTILDQFVEKVDRLVER